MSTKAKDRKRRSRVAANGAAKKTSSRSDRSSSNTSRKKTTGSASQSKIARQAATAVKGAAPTRRRASDDSPNGRGAHTEATPSPEAAGTSTETIGERIRRYRNDKGMPFSVLAERSGVSKGHLSDIESNIIKRPSGEMLYEIAKALGVLMSDLLGRPLISQQTDPAPLALVEFAREHSLPRADVEMLARIKFRGEQPRTKERWAHIYSAIRGTAWMDDAGT